MLKIYGNPISPPCNKVRYVCEFLGIEYEWVEKDFRTGELGSPEYRAIHPAGKVPAIDDDGFILFESEAIIRYISSREESSLYPQDPRARGLVDQWGAFCTVHVGAAITKVVFNLIIAPKFDLEVDERSMKEGREWLKRFLPIVDHQLAGNRYLAGDDLTVADITLLSNLDPAELADISLAEYENLSRWCSSLREMDFWKTIHSGT